MQTKKVLFYGDVSSYGYNISHLLLSNKIKHNFVYTLDYYILDIESVREIIGPEEIIYYLKNFRYVFDLYS
ncbi:hypothetical protein CMI47_18290 [Candidatus Pacearchaeota archaeon]|jgi:hypothetical protein|nr:hypothetical protein [Candidatus Pacearchaeota archaeon]